MTNQPSNLSAGPVPVDIIDPGPGTGVMIWRLGTQMCCLSSASVGGGITSPQWIINAAVPDDYTRTDLDTHAAELAHKHHLAGSGVALFTAANLAAASRRCRHINGHQIAIDATVGVTHPTWAAHYNTETESGSDTDMGIDGPHCVGPGTINIVIQMPCPLDPGAAVNLVMTATEAKTQALMARRVPGTGTASDAIVVVWPCGPSQIRFGGPRSDWGSATALGVYEAVLAGLDRHEPKQAGVES